MKGKMLQVAGHQRNLPLSLCKWRGIGGLYWNMSRIVPTGTDGSQQKMISHEVSAPNNSPCPNSPPRPLSQCWLVHFSATFPGQVCTWAPGLWLWPTARFTIRAKARNHHWRILNMCMRTITLNYDACGHTLIVHDTKGTCIYIYIYMCVCVYYMYGNYV